MDASEVTSTQPVDEGIAVPVPQFVVIVGEPTDGGSAFRIEEPARLLRVWALLRAASEQVESATLPPEGMPGLQPEGPFPGDFRPWRGVPGADMLKLAGITDRGTGRWHGCDRRKAQ